MLRHIMRRLLSLVPVMLGVSITVFLILQITPGDPARLMAGQQADPQVLQNIRTELGLNLPLHVQYWNFLTGALQGDLGRSYRSGRPVMQEIRNRLPNTIELAVAGMVFALLLGLTAGVLAAYKRNTLFDTLTMIGSLLGISMPGFWIAILLLLLFSLNLGWLPASGRGGSLWTAGSWRYILLPAFTLSLSSAAVLARITRATMIEVLNQEYIKTARAKGLGQRTVIIKHALKNAMIPVVTIAGIQFGDMLANTAIIETVFAWPGISRVGVQAIAARDFPMVQGVVLFTALVFVLMNLVVDMLYVYLDPRIKYE